MDDLKAKALDIENLVKYEKDSVVSREVIKKELGTVTFFAFDQGQGLSEHSAPFDAMVQIIDGEAEITISGEKHIVKKGEMIIMPANEPHALQAVNKPYKIYYYGIKACVAEDSVEDTLFISDGCYGDLNRVVVYPRKVKGDANG